VDRLHGIPGITLAVPSGAFYVLPDVSSFVGPGVEAVGWGPIPNVDALAMYLVESANVALVPGEQRVGWVVAQEGVCAGKGGQGVGVGGG
jgi:aspartate/methionine/tyrosine aminotransferase